MAYPTRTRGRRLWAVPAALGLLVSLFVVQAQADEDPLDDYLGDPGRTYPNLVPNVGEVSVQNNRKDETSEIGFEQGVFLWFDTWAQNLGDVPMQLTVDEVESIQTSTVSQCVSWRSVEAHVCSKSEPVGGFAWHEDHTHFHYQEFAAYQLRKVLSNNRPDYSDSGLVKVADKVSFCFIDSDRVQGSTPGPFYTVFACEAPLVTGISPGWTDIYGPDLPGQNFDIEDVPNGRYALIIDMDYANRLHETDDTDNYVEVIIDIEASNDPTHFTGRKATLVTKFWPEPDDRGTPTTTTTSTTTKKNKKPKNDNHGNGNG